MRYLNCKHFPNFAFLVKKKKKKKKRWGKVGWYWRGMFGACVLTATSRLAKEIKGRYYLGWETEENVFEIVAKW